MDNVRIGEVCLYTHDVLRLADFYRRVLKLEGESADDVHQTLISSGTWLTIYNDGAPRREGAQRICLAFTVADVDEAHDRLVSMGVGIVDKPTTRPWGARNMSFKDPDGNIVFLRSFPARE